MSSSEDSDCGDEEKNAALREALQCSFVQNVFNEVYNGNTAESSNILAKETKSVSNFEETIARVLAKRLDKNINEIDQKTVSTKSIKPSGLDKIGIKLFSNSEIITGIDLPNPSKTNCKVPPFKRHLNNEEYKKRAVESAVTSQWVHSKLNTKYWRDKKKPKLTCLKAVKSINNSETLICTLNEDNSQSLL